MTTNPNSNPTPKWKKWLLGLGIPALVIAISLALSPFWADYEKAILPSQLPAPAQAFLQTHYPQSKMALARKDVEWFEKDYEVILTDGIQLTFNRKGEWKSVRDKARCVPEAIVPEPVLDYVRTNHPDCCIKEISRGRRSLEVDLSNRLELTFDAKSLMLIDWDD